MLLPPDPLVSGVVDDVPDDHDQAQVVHLVDLPLDQGVPLAIRMYLEKDTSSKGSETPNTPTLPNGSHGYSGGVLVGWPGDQLFRKE